ncbi:MAG: class F420-dependent oxidoreductase [Hydrocarboniphaga sp.]|uniref:LLM class F420-dependent oxidoreductase n=1 Tax=Hydrocarboniphaga sp. TaxID=2033016 RepID=UPI00260632CE|nr:LLM class F420-dependent oxidoreductase [Hydrocarboniphaga sp.]MDB5968632.1 class F420-dependent oxidoreductase [Hydrocarboniphaga sp.]
MKINVTLPFDHTGNPEEFLVPEAVVEVSRLVERLGFDGGNVTDHPCPTGRWLDSGGHYAQDPFVMLSFVAAATTRLRLQTGILVLPYRNPFITARAVATLDLYSRGRVTLGLGAGYLKGEYRALGVDFDRRNEIMDEYLVALRTALSSEEFTFKGSGYEALGNRTRPAGIQKPHPPMLVGGNSKRAIRRAVELADGWYPFFTGAQLSNTARTAAMNDEEDLAGGLAYLREHCEKTGRTDAPKIVLGSIVAPGEKPAPAELIDKIGQFEAMGVSGCAIGINGRTRAEWCDNAQSFAENVLSKVSKD